MGLRANHPLAPLTPEMGFTIKEAPAPTISFMRSTIGMMAFSGGLISDQPLGRVGDTPRPLREVIPFSRGRVMPWKLKEHALSALARKWPGIKPFEFHRETAVLCCSGPSLGPNIHRVRELQKRGAAVMAVNRTQDFLLGLPSTHGVPWIKPWAGIILEPTPNAAEYMRPTKGVRYYIGSQCAPETFDRFENSEHYIWHARSVPELDECLSPQELAHSVPSVGSTCGMRALLFLYMLGFRTIHVFGMDSSYDKRQLENGLFDYKGRPQLHSHEKPEAIHDLKTMMIRDQEDRDITHYGNSNMIAQADEFMAYILWRDKMMREGKLEPHKLIVHGDGAIPDISRHYGIHADSMREGKTYG